MRRKKEKNGKKEKGRGKKRKKVENDLEYWVQYFNTILLFGCLLQRSIKDIFNCCWRTKINQKKWKLS